MAEAKDQTATKLVDNQTQQSYILVQPVIF